MSIRPVAVAANLALLMLGALAPPAAAGARDPLYVWTDPDGVVRYTTHRERIPLLQRDAAEVVVAAEGGALEARIAELEERIAEDEARLAAHLSAEGVPLDRADLQEVAERLPRLQAQLRQLLDRRDAPQPGASDAP